MGTPSNNAVPAVAEPAGVTIGATGQRARWSVSPWGSIAPWDADGSTALEWYVAASDRWHIPAQEPTVRQIRIDGAPVVETRVRIPDGDAVQRVWAVPNSGGTVIVEFENESPLPFAIAVCGAGVVTERPVANVPIQGIHLPDDAIVLPIGHKATVRVALGRSGDGRMRTAPGSIAIAELPPVLAVVRGWTRVVEQASRLVLPDARLVEAVVAARCDLLLEGPVDAAVDPVGFLLDVAELVRCGDDAEAWLLDIVEPVERAVSGVAKQRRSLRGTRSGGLDRADVAAACEAALRVAVAAGDERAASDLRRVSARVATAAARPSGEGGLDARSGDESTATRTSFADLRREGSVGRFVRGVERRLADGGQLLVGGMPKTWLGNNFEVHGLSTSATTTVSYAVRWHGERPAVLWEQHGEPAVTLTAPDIDPSWTSDAMSGEALWAAPVSERPARSMLTVTSIDPNVDGGSFS